MNVVVCVKQIPDPAQPGKLDPNTKTLVREGKLILDDSDAYGVEMGLQLAEKAGGGEVTLVCRIGVDGLAVAGTGSWSHGGGSSPAPTQLPELSRRILESVVDEYQCDGDSAAPSFRLVKRRTAA
jgi:hypothetical protein